MSELVDRLISASALREAIRAKCVAGVQREVICRLIASFVPDDIATEHECGRGRLPVELIPAHRRSAFFEALHRLPSTRRFA